MGRTEGCGTVQLKETEEAKIATFLTFSYDNFESLDIIYKRAKDLGYTKEDKSTFKGGINELEVSFFRNYGHNNIEVLGDTWSAAISWYINTYPIDWDATEENKVRDLWIDSQVPQSWILFGDPSLKIGGYS